MLSIKDAIKRRAESHKMIVLVSEKTRRELDFWLGKEMPLSAQISTAIDYAIEVAGYEESYV